MTGVDQGSVEVRELAAAIPSCAAVQVGDTFAYVAPAFELAGESPADELVGEDWRTGLAPETVARVRDGLPAVRADGEWRGAVPVGNDGGERTVDLTLRTANDDAVVWLVEDATNPASESQAADGVDPVSRRTSDRSPHAPTISQRFADTLLNVLDDVVYVIGEDGFKYWNDALAETTGYSHEALSETAPKELIPADQHTFVPGLLEAIDAIEDRRVDVDIRTRDGERILESRYRLHPEPDDEYRGSVGVVRDVTERETQAAAVQRQRTLIEGILNTIPDVVFAFDETGDPLVEEAMLDEFAGYTGEELAGLGPLGIVPEADRQGVMEAMQSVLAGGETVSYETDIVAKDGDRIPHEFRAAPLVLDGEVLGVVGSARDVTERREREEAMARQHDELATLDRINRLLLETTREVVQSASREAVERTVCDRLADSDLYQFAWVGAREFDGDRIVPRVTAGDDHGYLNEVTVRVAEESPGPAARAMQTGVVQIADVCDGDRTGWQATASEHGFESVAAIPLLHGDTVYGVLTVYATREDAFSAREQDGFDVLGRSVGAVIDAARNQELLFADAVVELAFRTTDSDSVFKRAASDLAASLALDGYVAADDQWILYVAVDGCRPDAVVDVMTGDDWVDRARVISETETGGRVEAVVSEALLDAVSAAGATLTEATATEDVIELSVEAPAGANVRAVVSHVQREFPTAELVATRERDRDITTVGRPGGLASELTDRQREALEAAYRAGYFAWPRESTAEEVAASLGLASSTLHGHLRKAEHQLLAELFDAGELGADARRD
jgi:PAS domain S-box-containing protein